MTDLAVPENALEIRLAEYLEGSLSERNFEVASARLRDPRPGEVVIRVDYLSLAAANGNLIRRDSELPIPGTRRGERVAGKVVGTVCRSNDASLSIGDLVSSWCGWGEYAVREAKNCARLDRELFPDPVYFLNQGPTAYYGMAELARAGAGDVVYVSGGAGSVGSLAGQIARCLGAKSVIGSAGSKEKVDYLIAELRYDAAFDYHDGPVADRLRELAPDGITVFFDTVGGEQFEAAVQTAAPQARFALCGSLSSQLGNAGLPRLDLMTAIRKHLELRPFAVFSAYERIQRIWNEKFRTWLSEGQIIYPHTIVEGGLRAAPRALAELLAGKHRGSVAVAMA